MAGSNPQQKQCILVSTALCTIRQASTEPVRLGLANISTKSVPGERLKSNWKIEVNSNINT